jgi:hypothetical protein
LRDDFPRDEVHVLSSIASETIFFSFSVLSFSVDSLIIFSVLKVIDAPDETGSYFL